MTAKFVNWSMATPNVGEPGIPRVGCENRARLRINRQRRRVDPYAHGTAAAGVRVELRDRVRPAGVGVKSSGVRGVRNHSWIEDDAGGRAGDEAGRNCGAENRSCEADLDHVKRARRAKRAA